MINILYLKERVQHLFLCVDSGNKYQLSQKQSNS